MLKKIDNYFIGPEGTVTDRIYFYGTLSWGIFASLLVGMVML